MRKKIILSVSVVAVLIVSQYFSAPIDNLLGLRRGGFSSEFIRQLHRIAWYVIPMSIVLFVFYKPTNILKELGLSNRPIKGLIFAFVATLPMLIGYALMGALNRQTPLDKIIFSAVVSGTFEEIFFRGFIFGQLFRRARWGFIPATALNGIVFGIGHLYQAKDIAGALSVFAVTFIGAVWFSWLYIENNENLWVSIGLHILMNFYWDIFSMGEGAVGGLIANVPRILTIALSIYLTIRAARKGSGLLIKRSMLWKNSYYKQGQVDVMASET